MAVNFSENIEYFEKVLISYLLYADDDYEITNDSGHKVEKRKLLNVLQPSFFVYPLHGSIIKTIKDFSKQYNGYLPSKTELMDYMKIHNIAFEDIEYKATTEVDLHQYTKDYVYRYILSFIKMRVLNAQISKVSVNIKTKVPSPETIDETFDYVRREFGENIDIDITNDDEGLDVFDPKSHIQPNKVTKQTGFEWLNYVLGGGYEPKTLIVLFGRPKVGKSLAISNMAVRAVKSGLNVCLITVELSAGKYTKRIGSNLFSIPKYTYDSFKDEKSLDVEKQYQAQFEESFPYHGKLITKEYPTGSVNAFDIENYICRQEKKRNLKFDVVYIDYLNLLNMDNVGGGDGGTYMPIKKTSEQLRKIAQRNDWCVVTATQAKQSAFEAEDLNMDDVAESSGVVATVDTLIGLISVPGSMDYRMKCVANRDNGFMGSYADYKKVFDFFRLEENGKEHIFMSKDDKNMLEHQCLSPVTLNAITVLQKTNENNKTDLDKPSVEDIKFDKDDRDVVNTPLTQTQKQPITFKSQQEIKSDVQQIDQQNVKDVCLSGKGTKWTPNVNVAKQPQQQNIQIQNTPTNTFNAQIAVNQTLQPTEELQKSSEEYNQKMNMITNFFNGNNKQVEEKDFLPTYDDRYNEKDMPF